MTFNGATMLSTAVFLATALMMFNTVSAVKSEEKCYCAPVEIEMEIDFDWSRGSPSPCGDWVTATKEGDGKGLMSSSSCSDLWPEDFEPDDLDGVTVKMYLVKETLMDKAGFPVTFDTTATTDLKDGDSFKWQSKSSAELIPTRVEVFVKVCFADVSTTTSGTPVVTGSSDRCETFAMSLYWTKKCQVPVPIIPELSLGIIKIKTTQVDGAQCGFSDAPTFAPTTKPTVSPTLIPTSRPTSSPSTKPSSRPTTRPTVLPTPGPSSGPTLRPTAGPSAGPTPGPSAGPTPGPSGRPTPNPSAIPNPLPTRTPDRPPTTVPTGTPPSTDCPKICKRIHI